MISSWELKALGCVESCNLLITRVWLRLYCNIYSQASPETWPLSGGDQREMQEKEQELQEFCAGLVWVRMGLCWCGCCAPISFELKICWAPIDGKPPKPRYALCFSTADLLEFLRKSLLPHLALPWGRAHKMWFFWSFHRALQDGFIRWALSDRISVGCGFGFAWASPSPKGVFRCYWALFKIFKIMPLFGVGKKKKKKKRGLKNIN